jgi:membrane protein DedA with SNARE-associated domain
MIEYLTSLAQTPNHPLGLLFLLASSVIEYVFPPFPGDTITLFGAILITAYHWNFFWMMLALTLGNVGGAALDFYLGVWARKKAHQSAEKGKKFAGSLETLAEKFKKHGEAYIVINRFLPGVRALFFYSAGFMGLRLRRVLFFAAISAIAWNVLIVAVGAALGANFERLQSLALEYAKVMWVLMAVVLLVVVVRFFWKKRRALPPS